MLLWRAKKNIILQGPPGVGKSFAAQRLAFALIGATDRDRLGFVQFHQSYSYEDFVEGYRPTAVALSCDQESLWSFAVGLKPILKTTTCSSSMRSTEVI